MNKLQTHLPCEFTVKSHKYWMVHWDISLLSMDVTVSLICWSYANCTHCILDITVHPYSPQRYWLVFYYCLFVTPSLIPLFIQCILCLFIYTLVMHGLSRISSFILCLNNSDICKTYILQPYCCMCCSIEHNKTSK